MHAGTFHMALQDENGQSRRLGPGDMVFFPAGSVSHWHVIKEVRKLAVCRQSMPRPFGFVLRAWNKLAAMLASPGEEGDPLDSGAAAVSSPERATAA
jgi:hypothetical protein